jgi:glycine/D-amino acid oxidase-like deaminating enzyme
VTSKPSWLIVGAGLAGACAAAALHPQGDVLVLDPHGPAAGASGAAAGLANPFAGRRAAPGWRHHDALAALHRLAEAAGAAQLIRQRGILRPARDSRQADHFRERAAEHADDLEWFASSDAAERWPDVRAPHGALWVVQGAAVDIPALVRALLAAVPLARQRVIDAGETAETAWVETAGGERLEAEHVLLAPGAGYSAFTPLAGLRLGAVKGQVAVVRPPPGLGCHCLRAMATPCPPKQGW